jgi:uncharacterized UBP type Zn finger protein
MCFSVDATRKIDSLGRYVNDEHRKPNSVMKKIVHRDTVHLCLFALRNIEAGDELRYDYGPDKNNAMPWRKKKSCKVQRSELKVVSSLFCNIHDLQCSLVKYMQYILVCCSCWEIISLVIGGTVAAPAVG